MRYFNLILLLIITNLLFSQELKLVDNHAVNSKIGLEYSVESESTVNTSAFGCENIRKAEKQPNWNADSLHNKWRYSIGYRMGNISSKVIFNKLNNEQFNQVNLNLGRKIGFLFYELDFSYAKIHSEGQYYNYYYDFIEYEFFEDDPVYDRKIDASLFNISTGIRLELLPRKRISPDMFWGVGLFFPFKFIRELNLISGMPINPSWPVYQKVETKLPFQMSSYYGLGLRLFLTPKSTLNASLRMETFDFLFKLPETNDEYLFDLSGSLKDKAHSLQIGLSFNRVF